MKVRQSECLQHKTMEWSCVPTFMCRTSVEGMRDGKIINAKAGSGGLGFGADLYPLDCDSSYDSNLDISI